MIKKIISLVFYLICFLSIFFVDVKASEKEIFLDYLLTQTSVSDIKTTIIPNYNISEEGDSLKMVSTKISLNEPSIEESSDTIFIIGEKRSISEDDYNWLTKIVQCEAGGEDEIGKILVANVIFNRFDTGSYGPTLKGVIFAHKQFQPVSSGIIYNAIPSQETIDAVKKALDGIDYSQGALYFMNRSGSNSSNVTWFDTALTPLFKHNGHEFFK